MLKPYYQDEWVTIYHGDCRDILPTLEKVDLVLTSPPYNLGNAVKGSFYGGKGKGGRIEYLSHDDDMPTKEYKEWQHQIISLCFYLLNDSGAIFYNHKPRIVNGIYDDRKDLLPLPIRQEIIWDRCGMVNFSGSFFACSTERLYIIAKDGWKPNKEYLGWGEVWRIPPEVNTNHPAPFPKKLAERVIVSSSQGGQIVLDPFLGSGTTMVAAKKLNRKCIGIEIEEKYCEIAAKRCSQSVFDLSTKGGGNSSPTR